MSNDECLKNDEARMSNGASIRLRFVIRASSFFRHSDFVIRHFYDLFRQFGPQIGAGFDAAMEIGQVEFLVRAVGVVVVQAPAQQQRIDSELLAEGGDDRESSLLRA